MKIQARARRAAGAGIMLFAVVLVGGGCVKRTLTITSDPDGATVVIDGKTVGVTPLELSFTFYGTREILLEKEGFATFKARHEINSPFWELFPVDFIPEVMIPFDISDSRSVHFVLAPLSDPLPEALLKRADEMRREAGERENVK